MRIIVTGAAGFIGSHLCTELREHEHDVFATDRVDDGIDLRSPECVDLMIDRAIEALDGEIDACVHLAAKVGRLFGDIDSTATIIDNVAMTALIAQRCAEHDIRMLYASTSEIYGDNGEELCDEHDGPFSMPHNLYGITKGWGEDVLRYYEPPGSTVLRFSMPYGPGLPAGKGRAAIINMLWQAINEKPIIVHRDSERSWCWIGDTVRAVRLILEKTDEGVFNVGRDDAAVSMLDVAHLACVLADAPKSLIKLVDPPQNQTVVKRLATERVRALGWQPEVSLRDGMARTLDWVREQEPAEVT